jgi:predicted AAA+ superfamily ATPase
MLPARAAAGKSTKNAVGDDMDQQLLRIDPQTHRHDVSVIEFALNEKIGLPEYFVGRRQDMTYLLDWCHRLRRKAAKSIMLVGRRKIGKSAIVERLYNILWTENDNLVPFYYEFPENKIEARLFAEDFFVKFYLQAIAFLKRDGGLIQQLSLQAFDYKLKRLEGLLNGQTGKAFDFIREDLQRFQENAFDETVRSDNDQLMKSALATPNRFAKATGVNVCQFLDEMQYMNQNITGLVEEVPSRMYMSLAESKEAPIFASGSYITMMLRQVSASVPGRFSLYDLFLMQKDEAAAVARSWAEALGMQVTDEIVDYIVAQTGGHPEQIRDILSSKVHLTKTLTEPDQVDKAIFHETRHGNILKDWQEYLAPVIQVYNQVNLKRILLVLSRYPERDFTYAMLKQRLDLDIDESTYLAEMNALHVYDIVERPSVNSFRAVKDRMLDKIFRYQYRHVLEEAGEAEFDDLLSAELRYNYTRELIQSSTLLDPEGRDFLLEKLGTLFGDAFNARGRYYEAKVLFHILKQLLSGQVRSPILSGLSWKELEDFQLGYAGEAGKEIDVCLEFDKVMIAIECKATKQPHKIKEVDLQSFLEKLAALKTDKEIRKVFFSQHGVTKPFAKLLEAQGIYLESGKV